MAGVATTCGCGVTIETPARDLVINGEVIAEGAVIDLDENDRAFRDHWRAEHPGEPLPERIL